jgi:hypothetical protein
LCHLDLQYAAFFEAFHTIDNATFQRVQPGVCVEMLATERLVLAEEHTWIPKLLKRSFAGLLGGIKVSSGRQQQSKQMPQRD